MLFPLSLSRNEYHAKTPCYSLVDLSNFLLRTVYLRGLSILGNNKNGDTEEVKTRAERKRGDKESKCGGGWV